MRPRPAAVLVAAVLLLGSACSDGDPDAAGPAPETSSTSPSTAPSDGPTDGPTGDPARDPEVPAPTLPPGLDGFERYVALGDSYTAAPGVPTTDTGDGCLRSDSNYPSLVAEALGAELADVSCTGAVSTSLVGVQQTGSGTAEPQFDALTPETDLVTVSIGGNDDNLFGDLVATCSQLGDGAAPGATPCRDRLEAGGPAALEARIAGLSERIAAVATGVQDRAPGARVVVVGYPQLVPAQGTCEELPLAAGDYPFARSVNQRLSEAVRAGAEEAGVSHVDLLAPSEGHDICADEPWVNGATTDPERALAFHPFAVEQAAVAQLVLDLLAQPEPVSGS